MENGNNVEEKMKRAKSTLKGKNILVTGGCGFIGSHLVKRLQELEANVRVFDKKIGEELSGVDYVQGDARNYTDLLKCMEGIQMVFHLSALLGVERIRDIPCEVMDVNLRGTINALKAAEAREVDRFLLASSSEIYGEPRKLPIAEDDDRAPISFYGISKLASEAYCQAYHEQRGLKTTRVRYFNVYGPSQTERFVVSIFISRVLRGEPPIIYGHGNQSRCYTYVDDAVKGTILAATLEEGVGEVFNIGNEEEEVSLLELAEYIIEISKKDGLRPVYRPFGDGIRVEAREIIKRRPATLKARTLLGYDTTISWREGIKRVMEWHLHRTSE